MTLTILQRAQGPAQAQQVQVQQVNPQPAQVPGEVQGGVRSQGQGPEKVSPTGKLAPKVLRTEKQDLVR